MFSSFDYKNGLGPRLYRTPEEIKRDITEVAERILEINEMLNVRNIISDIITEQSGDDLARRAEAISELSEFAGEVLYEMKELEASIEELRAELIESIDYMGI